MDDIGTSSGAGAGWGSVQQKEPTKKEVDAMRKIKLIQDFS